jgi:hypothetical protein
MLFANETVYDDANSKELYGDGEVVFAGGDRRLLARIAPPANESTKGFATPFASSGIAKIPRSEWSARLKEQIRLECRVSDYQNFPPHDQNGLPTCWANGPAHAATTMRVMQGLRYVELSSCSVAVPISGGHRGGYEGRALAYAAKYGFVSCKLWPNNSTNRSLMSNAACQADREHYKCLEWIDLGNDFEAYMTCAILGLPMAVAYNDWRHVVSLSDGVEIEGGSFGLRIRNNWGRWGAANKYGFYGYAVFREGQRQHGIPSSGFALRQVTSSQG